MFNATALSPIFAQGGGIDIFVIMGALAVVWIFVVVLPGRKEAKRKEEMIAALKKGDKVLVQPGIIGKVSQLKEDQVILDFDGTKIPFLRSTIIKVYE